MSSPIPRERRGGGGEGVKKKVPPVLSLPRITTLLASLLVSLCSGTNYVYSAYAPQLGTRLQISHTQLNIVAVAGNVGVYITGPILGRVVDRHGPRILIASAFALLLVGYGGIKAIYDSGLSPGTTTLPLTRFALLVLCSFLTGAGGDAGLLSAVNTTAKTFPESARGTTTSLVISGFGLSAFLFSSLGRLFDTSGLLGLLMLGTSMPMILGFFLVRPIPLPEDEVEEVEEEGESYALMEHDHLGVGTRHAHVGGTPTFDKDLEEEVEVAREVLVKREEKNIYGARLWRSGDFWLLFGILSLISGTGLMYINNIGSISQSLLIHSPPTSSPTPLATWQAKQVGTISITNFLGRILIGLLSDYTHPHLPPPPLLLLPSLILVLSQILSLSISSLNNLYLVSASVGLAYGGVFALAPVVCIDLFGIEHLSENWGFLAISPMISGNFFSLVFGATLDRHSSSPSSLSSSSNSSSSPLTSSSTSSNSTSQISAELEKQCLEGKACYIDAVRVTFLASLVAVGLSVWAGWRAWKRRRRG